MINLTQHIEVVRQRPEHVRKQIALIAATAITAVIAVIWLGTSVATGAFALKGTSFADATSGTAPEVVETSGGFSNLLGAAGAVFSGGTQEGPARVEVVSETAGASAASQTTAKEEATILPF